MKFSHQFAWLALVLFLNMPRPANCQDIFWMQPYNGNIVYGPLGASTGEMPNCPKCQCPTCQPGGCKGCIQRFFGRISDKFRSCRRELYFWNEMYHTGYDDPVLPPYCEPAYGYYETAWRRPAVPPIPCELLPECNPPLQPELEAPVPVPTPMPQEALPPMPPQYRIQWRLQRAGQHQSTRPPTIRQGTKSPRTKPRPKQTTTTPSGNRHCPYQCNPRWSL